MLAKFIVKWVDKSMQRANMHDASIIGTVCEVDTEDPVNTIKILQ